MFQHQVGFYRGHKHTNTHTHPADIFCALLAYCSILTTRQTGFLFIVKNKFPDGWCSLTLEVKVDKGGKVPAEMHRKFVCLSWQPARCLDYQGIKHNETRRFWPLRLTLLFCLLSAEKVSPIVSAHTQTALTHTHTHAWCDKQTRTARRLKKLPASIAEWKDINI